MSIKIRLIVSGVLFLIISTFIYFTVRFKYIEQDYIHNLITVTNDIIRSYQTLNERITRAKKRVAPSDLSDFIKAVHGTYKDIALLAVTDRSLSVRLSSKNDRFIRSADLFEAILKDFTQERFNISVNNPYAIRYYDENTGNGITRHKFYVFLSKIGQYRLLIVYPYHFEKKILVRTSLELSLIVFFTIIFVAMAYILSRKRSISVETPAHDTGDMVPAGSLVSAPIIGSPPVISAPLSGRINDLFTGFHRSYTIEGAFLYIYCSPGRLVKVLEMTGDTLCGTDLESGDAIPIDTEAGSELQQSSAMVLDDGKKIILPLVHNDVFLGTVHVVRQSPITGKEMQDMRAGINAVIRDVYEYVMLKEKNK